MAATKTRERTPEPSGDDSEAHLSLRFDRNNPRSGDREFSNDDEVLKYLIQHADIDELVTSMQSAGWVDFEPLIVEKGSRVVLEGNRRLAALRLLSDEGVRNRLGYKVPNGGTVPKLPEKIRVRLVKDRKEARAFIAFKHINGPFKWDALAKAKYAAQWIDDEHDLDQVSKQIGDTHNTVLRLVNGWRVLEQANQIGFDVDDITARRFNFSHLYTALSRPNMRTFLGLPEDTNALLGERPVAKAHHEDLMEVMGWLFGQAKAGRQHIVKSQNPDLNRLVKILGSKQATAVLKTNKDFDRAFEIVEPAAVRFEESLLATANIAEKTLGLVSHFDPAKQTTLMGTVNGLATTVRSLRDAMRTKQAGDDDL